MKRFFENDFVSAILLFIIVTSILLMMVSFKLQMDNKDKQLERVCQLAVEKGFAWYNPTNGNFEILTNR